MPTFTTIVHGVPTLGVEAYDIHSVVRDVAGALLDGQPKQNKVKISYGLLDQPHPGHVTVVCPLPDTMLEVNPPKVHHAFLTLLNVRRRELEIAHVWGEQPMVPGRQFHANDYKHHISCKSCGSSFFYNVGRSLDYENHICAGCGAEAHTLTETGASA